MITTEVRKARRGGRPMAELELSDFLKGIRYGTLSFLYGEGWPDMRPLNFAFNNGNFYFHANGFTGEKLKYLDCRNKVVISLYQERHKQIILKSA